MNDIPISSNLPTNEPTSSTDSRSIDDETTSLRNRTNRSTSITGSLPLDNESVPSMSKIVRSLSMPDNWTVAPSLATSTTLNDIEKDKSLLDIKNLTTGPRYQISHRHRLLNKLEKLDHYVSYHIHQLQWGIIGDTIILIPALLFSAYSIPILIFLSFLLVPLPIAIILVIGCITTLFITANLKKYTRRIRPGLHVVSNYRNYNIRAWEKTNAMPSGDSAQAGLWLTILAIYTHNPYFYIFIPFTQFGRVYFACHWVGDTIIGASIGILMGNLLSYIRNYYCYELYSIHNNKQQEMISSLLPFMYNHLCTV